jgi:hypothetical protein
MSVSRRHRCRETRRGDTVARRHRYRSPDLRPVAGPTVWQPSPGATPPDTIHEFGRDEGFGAVSAPESMSSLCDEQTGFVTSPPLICWRPAPHRFRRSIRDVGPRQKRAPGHADQPQSGGFLRGMSPRSPLFVPRFRLASEHSSLTGGREYALVSVSGLLLRVFPHTAREVEHYRCNRSNSRSKSVCCAFRR